MSRATRSPTYVAWQLRQPCALATPARCEGPQVVHHVDPDDDIATVTLCTLHGELASGKKVAQVGGGYRWPIPIGTLRLEALRAWMRFTKTAPADERRQAWREIEECLA